MKLNLTTIFNARYWSMLAAMMMLSVLTACGGGNGPAGAVIGGSGAATESGVISLAFKNAAGVVQANNTISAGGSLYLYTNVVDGSGNPVANTLVTFAVSVGSTSATLVTSSALTDKNGNCIVQVTSGATPGAGTITATAIAVGTTPITTPIDFENL